MGEKELTRRMVDGLDVHQVNPMNVNYQNMKRRTLYYWSQVYLMRLPSGANYNDLRPTITINILAFELLPQDEPHAMYSIYNPKTHDRLNNDMELHFLELPKFVKGVQKPIREMTKMERWMAYFANRMNQSEKEELAMSEAAINKAYDATGIFLQDKAERLKYIKPGGNWTDIPFDLLPKGMQKARRSDHTKRYGRVTPDGLASTIMTKCDPHWGAFFHYEQDRSFTVREAARIQSFPDHFVFTGNQAEQFAQVGNAVPPLLAESVGLSLRSVLEA